MAQVAAINGTQLKIAISDGAVPPAFVIPCIINGERGIVWSSDGSEEEIPDCDDPEALAWNTRTQRKKKGTITGAGLYDEDDFGTMWDWYDSGLPKAVQIQYGGKYTVQGNWILTDLGTTGNRGEKAKNTLTLISDGPQVMTVTP